MRLKLRTELKLEKKANIFLNLIVGENYDGTFFHEQGNPEVEDIDEEVGAQLYCDPQNEMKFNEILVEQQLCILALSIIRISRGHRSQQLLICAQRKGKLKETCKHVVAIDDRLRGLCTRDLICSTVGSASPLHVPECLNAQGIRWFSHASAVSCN
nr:hypothetical protein HmN_000066800 [Hymenolepis microstoma]